MKLPRFLTTPLPPSVVSLGDNEIALALLSRRRDALLRVGGGASRERVLPAGAGRPPAGRPAAPRRGPGEAGAAGRQAAGPGTVVLPTAWVRCVQVETGGLPRQRREAEDVIRWRLKKLLPCRPEEVRLDFLPAGGDGRVMVVLALDHPLSVIEDALAAAGMKVGRIEPTVLAVTSLVPPGRPAAADRRHRGALAGVRGHGGRCHHPAPPERPAGRSWTVRPPSWPGRWTSRCRSIQPPSEGARPVEVWVVALDETRLRRRSRRRWTGAGV